MKSIVIGLSLVALTAGTAFAAPGKHRPGHANAYERVAIAKSAAELAQLKRRAWSDGRLSIFERMQIRNAESRHSALVRRARHS